ncbi:hypothetical protein C475_10724, partial [Halosimplex carlsbadense 2-9-1]
ADDAVTEDVDAVVHAGVAAAVALELFLAVLSAGSGFAVLTVVTYVIGAAGLTRLVLRWSGGFVTTWAAVFPPMFAFAWRLFSYAGPGPSFGQILGPAVAYTLGVGTVWYALGAALLTPPGASLARLTR